MSIEFAVRALLSGLIVAAIALISRKNPGLGGLIASIPLVPTLGMIWLWRDTGDTKLVADYGTAHDSVYEHLITFILRNARIYTTIGAKENVHFFVFTR